MSTYKPKEGVKFEKAQDALSAGTRIDRGVKIGSQAKQSALYADPEVKTAVDHVVADTDALKKEIDDYSTAEAAFKKARSALVEGITTWDGSYRMLIAAAEKHCATADDGTGLGLAVRGKTKYPLAPPVSVALTYDKNKEVLRIRVVRAPGNRNLCVEVSPDPFTPGSWVEQPGHGSVHAIKVPAPGTWWARAASRNAKTKSDFTAPISVVVK